jgi:hypothetical protein
MRLLVAACLCLLALYASGSAQARGARVFPSWWLRAALCVHSHEGSWRDAGAPYYGGMQFDLGTWRSNGGLRYASYPHYATPHEQLRVAYATWQRRGWYPWPTTARMCGLL